MTHDGSGEDSRLGRRVFHRASIFDAVALRRRSFGLHQEAPKTKSFANVIRRDENTKLVRLAGWRVPADWMPLRPFHLINASTSSSSFPRPRTRSTTKSYSVLGSIDCVALAV
jgi:hypothetical protein